MTYISHNLLWEKRNKNASKNNMYLNTLFCKNATHKKDTLKKKQEKNSCRFRGIYLFQKHTMKKECVKKAWGN